MRSRSGSSGPPPKRVPKCTPPSVTRRRSRRAFLRLSAGKEPRASSELAEQRFSPLKYQSRAHTQPPPPRDPLARPHAVRALERREKLGACEGVALRAERVPLLGLELVKAAQESGLVGGHGGR